MTALLLAAASANHDNQLPRRMHSSVNHSWFHIVMLAFSSPFCLSACTNASPLRIVMDISHIIHAACRHCTTLRRTAASLMPFQTANCDETHNRAKRISFKLGKRNQITSHLHTNTHCWQLSRKCIRDVGIPLQLDKASPTLTGRSGIVNSRRECCGCSTKLPRGTPQHPNSCTCSSYKLEGKKKGKNPSSNWLQSYSEPKSFVNRNHSWTEIIREPKSFVNRNHS
jgi:hypothetical protein